MDDQRRAVGVMNDRARDAPQQHRTDAAESSRTHDDCRRVVALGGLEDRPPDRPAGLDRHRFGLEARLLRYPDAVGRDAATVFGCGPIQLGEVDHCGGRFRPGDSTHTGERLPHGHDKRVVVRQQRSCAFDGVLGIL
jgi:hypothetical protein